ncbi:hypothetical protein COCSUDRAFT_60239 [Coccomyxa subellipsoidea C-169]|uniref:Uncharacterized protein n=1 Tax=Coccomyxa subellipsoidea (strain C-169) TaxID=574566 RepID=I0YJK6_COCSC|nr:hypothetical protein COCSUDRAFT_60239 [Coccomyxa subellipsoidea C-169]EIE18575.1 hypothetical protein COCSUDRAFT_60239 [Coccomyxa subellipsoidea C-169]|eukprot:XP_005643119.1 hypothetical protein COCSUDRAFT_60239 [Coccomyxa subellipsoidea C-169]
MSHSAANTPCFSGRVESHNSTHLVASRQGRELFLSRRLFWRKERSLQGKTGAGGLLSVSDPGYVRRTSSRLIPDLNGDGKHMTIGRPLSDDDFDEYMDSRRNGKH